jgi:6-phosphogluconolactonase
LKKGIKMSLLGKVTSMAVLTALSLVTNTSYSQAQSQLYVATNQTTGNLLLKYDVSPNGALRNQVVIPTGGVGTGTGLGNQSGIAVSDSQRNKWLAVVNASSNDVSLFKAYTKGAYFLDKVQSGGVRPVSVSIRNNLVYVLNAGDASSPSTIAGFRIKQNGKLLMIENSQQVLSNPASGPAQIAISPDGSVVAVTEKATNLVTTFDLDKETGIATNKRSIPSNGQTPFGFAWANKNSLVVSEAFGGMDSAVSEYRLLSDGALNVVSGSIDAGEEKAACWISFSPSKRFAYTTNTMTNSISQYERSNSGLTLVAARALETMPGPIDFEIDNSGRFGAVLVNGGIQSFTVSKNGSLKSAFSESGIPTSSNGLVLVPRY